MKGSEEVNRLIKITGRGLAEPSRAPLLWVGAGLSIPSGYPSLAQLAERLRNTSPATLHDGLSPIETIDAFVKENGYSRKQSSVITETLLEIIKQTLESGEDVLISGFGKFKVKYKRQRRGRNPATCDDLTLPHRRVITFKCSGILRDRINNGWMDSDERLRIVSIQRPKMY